MVRHGRPVELDALAPPEEPVHHDADASLLAHLADDGFVHRLPQLDAPTRDRPGARGRTPPPPHEQEPLADHRDTSDADDRGFGRSHDPASSTWCITIARAVNPCSSKKFFAAR